MTAVATISLRELLGVEHLPVPHATIQRPKATLGDPAPLACTVAKVALETVLGSTGLDQITRWVTADVRTRLAQQHSLARRAGLTGVTAHIQRVRVSRVSDRAAEVSVVANDGTRTRAIAARFEDHGGRWITTVLEIG